MIFLRTMISKSKFLALLGVCNFDYVKMCYIVGWARLILCAFVICGQYGPSLLPYPPLPPELYTSLSN